MTSPRLRIIASRLFAAGSKRKATPFTRYTTHACWQWWTDVLGLPPTWYKSFPYRSRVVKDPRGVLADFGVTLPAETEIRVWDSTAETRYMVVPMRPSGTDGWSEERLANLVTRDSMVGTGLAKNPGEVA